MITLHWFLTVFSSVVHIRVLLRIWDLFFYEGSVILFQVTLAMFKLKEKELLKLENSAQIFNALSDLPGEIDEVDKLIEVSLLSVLNCLTHCGRICLSEPRNEKHLSCMSSLFVLLIVGYSLIDL